MKIHTFEDYEIIKKMYEARGVNALVEFQTPNQNILELMHKIKDKESYDFINLVYNAERTEINAMVQETYSEIFNLDNFELELKNTRSYKLAIQMQNCIEPTDYVKRIIKSIQRSIDPTLDFNFDETVKRINFQGKRLMKNLLRLIQLIKNERQAFDSYFSGILLNKTLYEQVINEKLNIGLIHVDPIKNLKIGIKRGKTRR